MNETKPGYKTTEFWLSTVSAIAGIVIASGAVGVDNQWVQMIAMLAAGLSSAGYAGARATTKAKASGPAVVG